MKGIKEVSEEKFNSIMAQHITLRDCKRCGYLGAEVVVRMPQYGKYGACVRCSHCGTETKTYSVSYPMICGARYGTPTIKRSLMYGIERAIKDWNERAQV